MSELLAIGIARNETDLRKGGLKVISIICGQLGIDCPDDPSVFCVEEGGEKTYYVFVEADLKKNRVVLDDLEVLTLSEYEELKRSKDCKVYDIINADSNPLCQIL